MNNKMFFFSKLIIWLLADNQNMQAPEKNKEYLKLV